MTRRRLGLIAAAFTLVAGAGTALAFGVVYLARATPVNGAAAAPIAPGFQSSLRGVACPDSVSCIAVGSYATSPIANHTLSLSEQWDGRGWSVLPSASPASDTEFHSIACPLAKFCVAVGFAGPAGNASGDRALIEGWSGDTWLVEAGVPAGQPSDLESVACPAPDSCWAVGYEEGAHVGLPNALIEHWDGTAWSRVHVPTLPGTFTSELNGVSCVANDLCLAVGSYGDTLDDDYPDARTLAERWDGKQWTALPGPNPATGNHDVLLGVTCQQRGVCVAVGDYSRNGSFYHADDQALVAEWGSGSWTAISSPTAGSGSESQLQAVACPRAVKCVGVGFRSVGADANPHVVVEAGDVSAWAEVSGLSPPGHDYGVACQTPSRCLLVGDEVVRGAPLGRAQAVWLTRL